MKKLFLFSCVALSLAIVSCNNKPKEEELPIDQAVEEMTEAIADTTEVAATETDSAMQEAATETTEEAAH